MNDDPKTLDELADLAPKSDSALFGAITDRREQRKLVNAR
jgi:hypothetical protein